MSMAHYNCRPWFTVIQIQTEQIADLHSPQLDNLRTLQVFLPPLQKPLQKPNRRGRPKLLLVNDGQDWQALHIKETLERLYASDQIAPMLVVAIPTNSNRLNEYGTAQPLDYKGRGAHAAAYTRFVVDTVLPLIEQRYHLGATAATTAFLGASLGGLSAFDIAWHHPEHFGTVGVFSGSFWWRTNSATVLARTTSRIAHQIVRESAPRAGMRFWFQTGTRDETDDRDQNGVIDSIQDTTELIDELCAKGYRKGREIAYLEVNGGQHHPSTWASVLDQFLMFAFGTH